jgi:shikimate dehydrogenase
MIKFCVIGQPITHSKSPVLHEAGFSEMGIEATFSAIEIFPENLKNWIEQEAKNYHGIAITIPHKEKLLSLVDQVSEAAEKIGAINTLYWQENMLLGTNTDALGVLKAIQTEVLHITGKKVLILGAGGAARAAIFAMQTAGADIFLWNRTVTKAQKLSEELGIDFIPDMAEINSDEIDIVINATSVGLKEWKSPLDPKFFAPHQYVFDMVYDPLETRFLSEAGEADATIITGEKMLVHQAVEQFRLWHHIALDPIVMERAFFG